MDSTGVKRSISHRAFTVVELVVVVAIGSILIALIAGASNRVRLMSDNIGCVSNLRSIGLAIVSYAGDHDGYLPGPSYGSMPATYAYSLSGPYVLPVYLAPYLGSPTMENAVPHTCGTFLCPAYKYKKVLPAAQWNRARSYTAVYQLPQVQLSGGLMASPWGRPESPGLNMNSMPLKLSILSTLVNPSTAWAIMDADASANLGGDGLSPTPVHSKHWNRLYFDFHVEATPTQAP